MRLLSKSSLKFRDSVEVSRVTVLKGRQFRQAAAVLCSSDIFRHVILD